MTDEQRAKLMMYHRLVVFLTANAGDFTGTDVATLLTELETIIDDIHDNAALQEVGTEPDTTARGTKRKRLIRLCNRFESTGKSIGTNQGDEVMVATFNIQKPYSDMADEELVTAAIALKNAATPLGTQFQALGWAATFLADFQTAIDDFHNTLGGGGGTVQATSTIGVRIARGDVIVQQLDTTVGNRYDTEEFPATKPKRDAYDSARQVLRIRTQPLEVTLIATRSGNVVTGNVTLSRAAEINDTVTLRWLEQGGPALFTDGPVTTFVEGATAATATVTVGTANPVEVVARVIRGDGSQFDSAAVVV